MDDIIAELELGSAVNNRSSWRAIDKMIDCVLLDMMEIDWMFVDDSMITRRVWNG